MESDYIKDLIRSNINKLSINNVRDFFNKNNLSYNDKELVIIYNFVMYNYNELLNENIKVFESIKSDINPKLYKDLLDLYIKYKKYI